MTEPETPREPVLNLPGAVTVILIALAGIHLFRSILPPESDQWVIWTFGFVPARFDTSVLGDRFAEYGGEGAKIWTFLTYSFLHADVSHLAFNLLWLLPFGSAVARRFGAIRFFLFLAVSAIAGAAAHLVTHVGELAPMIGASAAVSGAMAAAIRFAFGRGSFLSFRRGDADAAARVPALPLFKALAPSARDRLSGGLVRHQHHLRLRLEPVHGAVAERRLAGAYRRISRRALAVLAVRSNSSRIAKCRRLVDCGRDATAASRP